MQAISTNIRVARWNSFGAKEGRQNGAEKQKEDQAGFASRQAQVAAIKEAIVMGGSPELHSDSTALCSHFKLRKGRVGSDYAEAQVYTHVAGIVIRFWVYGEDFSVKCRDLVLLPQAGDKGYDIWLEADGRVFPHEGKYLFPGLTILCNKATGK